MTDELYHLWTGTFPEISGKSFSMICDYFGGAEAVFNESDEKLQDVLKPAHFRQLNIYRRENLIRGFAEELKRKEIAFTYPGHELYPERLLNIPDRPRLLFIMGQHTVLEELNAHPSLAVVGSRMATNYGISMCRRIVSHVAKEGVAIISGMAAGIDGVAHSTVLDHHDKVINALSEVSDSVALTVGVLGCGIDKIYPAENRKLFNRMYEQGVVISEYPPGTEPVRHHFPLRNRIISGLSDGVLVVEAKAKSGSLITADQALEQGKDVYALPGPVNSVLSQGCHRLIKQGAGILITPEELMDEWNINPVEIGQKGNKSEKMLESPEFMVYSCLDLFPKGTNQLMKETGLSVTELMERLITLELNGYVKEVSRNYYIRLQ